MKVLIFAAAVLSPGLLPVLSGGAAACLLAAGLYRLMKKAAEEKRRDRIRSAFGQIPPEPRYMDEVRIYHEQTRDILPGESIDDITWNDLEMDRVFARINHTGSYIGEQVLYRRLHAGTFDGTEPSGLQSGREVSGRELSGQDAAASGTWEKRLRFLEENEEVRTDLEVALAAIGKVKEDYHLPVFLLHAAELDVGPVWLYRGLQCLLAAALIGGTVFRQEWCLFGALFVALVNVCVYSAGKMRCGAYLSALGSIREMAVFGQFLVKKEEYRTLIPKRELEEAIHALRSVTRRIGHFQLRKHGLMTGDVMELMRDYLIGATLWDFTVFHWLTRQIEGKLDHVLTLYEGIGELDMDIAVCSFRRSLPYYCIPENYVEKRMDMEQMYHPLLNNPVGNDWHIEKNCILTGSNASGKSTFIKALAVNAILARGIHTCAAARFCLPPMYVVTSMTVRDDISAGESYYIREVKYLKRLVGRCAGPGYTLCVIDEILKGTNTKERLAASEAVLRYMEDTDCLTIAATHDRELAAAMEDVYENYHFRNYMEDGEIRFDYRLYRGISNSSNAVALLEVLGFPEEIVSEAGRLCR